LVVAVLVVADKFYTNIENFGKPRNIVEHPGCQKFLDAIEVKHVVSNVITFQDETIIVLKNYCGGLAEGVKKPLCVLQ
jgi:hypothetical protein